MERLTVSHVLRAHSVWLTPVCPKPVPHTAIVHWCPSSRHHVLPEHTPMTQPSVFKQQTNVPSVLLASTALMAVSLTTVQLASGVGEETHIPGPMTLIPLLANYVHMATTVLQVNTYNIFVTIVVYIYVYLLNITWLARWYMTLL